MAINKITWPTENPTTVTDYQAQNNLLIALLKATQIPRKTVEIDSTWYIRKGTIFYVGGSTYYVDANTNISGTATPYIKLTPSEDGSTLSASYVTNLTGVSWNDEYSGYYDSSGNYYIFGEVTAIVNGQISEIKYDHFNPAVLGTNWIPTLTAALGTNWTTILQNNAHFSISANLAAGDYLLQVTAATKYFVVTRPCLVELSTGSAGGVITPRYYRPLATNTPYLSRSDAGQSYCVLMPGHYELSCTGSIATIWGIGIFGASSFDGIITEEA